MTRDEARTLLREEYYRLAGSNTIQSAAVYYGLDDPEPTRPLWRASTVVRKYPNDYGVGFDEDHVVALAKAWLDVKAQVRARGGI